MTASTSKQGALLINLLSAGPTARSAQPTANLQAVTWSSTGASVSGAHRYKPTYKTGVAHWAPFDVRTNNVLADRWVSQFNPIFSLRHANQRLQAQSNLLWALPNRFIIRLIPAKMVWGQFLVHLVNVFQTLKIARLVFMLARTSNSSVWGQQMTVLLRFQ